MARFTDTGTEPTLPKTGTSVGLTCHSGQQGDHRRERGTMTRRSTRLLDAALVAAESGLYVFPVTPRIMWSVKLSHPSGCRTVAVAAAPRRAAESRCVVAVAGLVRGGSW